VRRDEHLQDVVHGDDPDRMLCLVLRDVFGFHPLALEIIAVVLLLGYFKRRGWF
jgi:hypothetical protein